MNRILRASTSSRWLALGLCVLLMAILVPLISTTSLAATVPNAPALGVPPVSQIVVNPGVLAPASTQFDITGLLQTATLDPSCAASPHCGGTLMINNHAVVVPKETIVILPANALTWQELFALAPAPYSGVATGMAIADSPAPINAYEVHVVGNRVGGTYIAGLIHVSQELLNSGAGYINFIDYDVGPNHDAELRVGGLLSDPNCVAAPGNPVAGGPNCSGARVRINDPANPSSANGGRFGRPSTPDARFTVDQDNPTITAATGYPMCIPRVRLDPTLAGNADDPLCPLTNRPLDPAQFNGFALTTNTVIGGTVIPGYIPDAAQQAPMEVGDYITFAGTLVNDTATPTAAVPGAATYISAHTISDNFAAYTQPGVNPAYVSIEVSLAGTGGLTVIGAAEAAVRTRFEGMTTDPTRNVHIYGIDINPATGALIDRDWGYVSPDPGPPTGAVLGRWRFLPPCTATVGTVSEKKCVGPPSGDFIPPTREVRAVIDGVNSMVAPNALLGSAAGFTAPLTSASATAANGIVFGQYHAPIGEYIFPENLPGAPIVPNNFEAIPFLAYGGYVSAGGTKVGQLSPWPGAVAPGKPVCVTPTINGGPFSVANGSSITLAGSVNANATSPVALTWTAGTTPSGTDLNGALSNAHTTTPTFSGISLPQGSMTVTFTASNVCGAQSVSTTVNVAASPPPTIDPLPIQSVSAGSLVSLSATSPSFGPLNFTFTQTGGPGVLGGTNTRYIVGLGTNVPATISFTAPAAGSTLTFNVTVTNVNGTSSPMPVTLTVSPAAPVNILLNPADYRIAKQRLVITATTNDQAAILTLQPYLTQNGTIFDPTTLGSVFTHTGGGIYTLTLVGAPQPAADQGVSGSVQPFTPGAKPLIVLATHAGSPTLTGTSGPTALTIVRLN